MNALSDIKSKIEKNKEEKRERLLASATALFAEKNFNPVFRSYHYVF